MIKPEQIPDEVVNAYMHMILYGCVDGAEVIAAAINAWPGMSVFPGMQRGTRETPPHIVLPLPTENSNAEG